MAGKHSPNGLRSYLDIHETVLQRFEREGNAHTYPGIDSRHRHAFDWQTGEILEEMREWYWPRRVPDQASSMSDPSTNIRRIK